MLPVLRILLWTDVGLGVLAALLGALLSYYRVTADAAFVLILVSLVAGWVAVALGPIVSHMTTRERRARYELAYPTRDALLNAVDGEAIRTIRDSKGPVRATRELRKQVPGVPLTEAVAIVNSR